MEQGNRLEHITIYSPKNIPHSDFTEQLKAEIENIISVVADKRAIPSLIDLLDDEVYEIRWVAAESLIRIGQRSILPILRQLREGRQFLYPAKVHYVLESLGCQRTAGKTATEHLPQSFNRNS